MKIKTRDLIGPALDWAVAKCEGIPLTFAGRKWPTDGANTVEYAPWAIHPVVNGAGPYVGSLCHRGFSPSTDGAQGGPIIEREKIGVHYEPMKTEWTAMNGWAYGPTPLIAAMRCFVASKLGEEVDVPEELIK